MAFGWRRVAYCLLTLFASHSLFIIHSAHAAPIPHLLRAEITLTPATAPPEAGSDAAHQSLALAPRTSDQQHRNEEVQIQPRMNPGAWLAEFTALGKGIGAEAQEGIIDSTRVDKTSYSSGASNGAQDSGRHVVPDHLKRQHSPIPYDSSNADPSASGQATGFYQAIDLAEGPRVVSPVSRGPGRIPKPRAEGEVQKLRDYAAARYQKEREWLDLPENRELKKQRAAVRAQNRKNWKVNNPKSYAASEALQRARTKEVRKQARDAKQAELPKPPEKRGRPRAPSGDAQTEKRRERKRVSYQKRRARLKDPEVVQTKEAEIAAIVVESNNSRPPRSEQSEPLHQLSQHVALAETTSGPTSSLHPVHQSSTSPPQLVSQSSKPNAYDDFFDELPSLRSCNSEPSSASQLADDLSHCRSLKQT